MKLSPAAARAGLAFPLAAFPLLNPFSSGPSAAVVPWLAGAVCALLLWLLASAGPQPPRVPRGLLWGCVALVAWAALSQLTLRPETVMLAGGLAIIAVSAGFSRDETIARALQAGVLAAAAASAVIGLCQYFGVAARFSPWMNGAEAGEAYANLRQPNQYATLCWAGAAILLFGTLRIPRWGALALVVLLAAGSAASVSRTGMLQGVVLTLLCALWAGPQRRQRLLLCGAAALAYFAATVLLPVLLETLNGAMPARTLWGRLGGGQPCSSRIVLWSNVLHLIALEPLTGWGWGELDYAHFDTLYGGGSGPRFCDILDNAHNLPLHLAVELGVPAALLVCGVAAWWAWRQRPWRETEAPRQLAWALLAIVLFHSLLEYPLWYAPFQILFGASLGWLLPRDAREVPAAYRVGSAGAAVLLLAATGYAAWDYARVSQIYLPPEQRRSAWSEDTLSHVRRSWLFAGQARFADLTLVPPQRDNAEWMYALSRQVLHYSPEPRVIERALESATWLGHDDEAVLLLARYRAAFPRDYEAWRQAQRLPMQLPR
ncbi:MAG TPA: Wzy polymerase domain-containing protein [Ramlibacter sp.]